MYFVYGSCRFGPMCLTSPSLGGLLYAVGGVSGFRRTDQLDSIER